MNNLLPILIAVLTAAAPISALVIYTTIRQQRCRYMSDADWLDYQAAFERLNRGVDTSPTAAYQHDENRRRVAIEHIDNLDVVRSVAIMGEKIADLHERN